MTKTCLIIVDGLRYDTALSDCGYLQAAVEAGHARLWKMQSELPTISAPLYETIHTGLPPVEHGIIGNEMIRPSNKPNLFSILKQADRVTGAVAHCYYHTLYGGSSFDPFEHGEINNPDAPVPHARYYSMEGYCPENSAMPAEVDMCAQVWGIARDHAPDYLLFHTSSCDTLGHWFGGESSEYRIQASKVDIALARLIPRLREAGYEVFVTADHGINSDHHHAGDQPELRQVPFYVFSDKVDAPAGDVLDQKSIAPTVLKLLGMDVPETMRAQTLC
ncbi:alkaline phosphatase family protein [Roseovarius sp. EL26]|uniref:alkaline phosphatase family protein n=1 Tax=Roseovarius sp. EL26 TaxID=2126672 RepID=UPI000EA2CEFD|nr:alkaline phosphatase family protein [Roseovarius sp. EL26]